MKHFKYLIFLILSFISFDTFAACPSNNPVAFTTSPGSVGSKHCIEYYNDYCEVVMQSGTVITANGNLPWASLTGNTCQLETEPYECEEDVCAVTEQQTCPSTHTKGMYNGQLSCVRNGQDTLECTADYCFNPNNKFCPSGYVRGTFNDQSVCVKNNSDNPDIDVPDQENPDDEDNQDNSEIKSTLNEIKTSIDTLTDTVSNSFTELKDLLTDFINNDNENTDNDNDDNNTDVDTSSLDADVPFFDYSDNEKSLNINIFSSSAQCPQDNTLSMNVFNRTFSYTFKYQSMCNALSFLGYFILIIAYLFAARIVTQA